MKKEKKEKGPKKKWSVFKTIVVVFAAVIFVVGAVLGGIYLAGGLRKKRVAPQGIQIELYQPDPIQARYNSATGQIEATADFWLVVTTDTADITESTVKLELTDRDGGNNNEIWNSSIRVPTSVTIGEPFKVTAEKANLTKSDGDADRLGLKYDANGNILNDKDEIVEGIKGGISTLTATSTAIKVNPPSASVKIAVDTPAYKVGTVLTSTDGEELIRDEDGVYQITQNDSFKADMIFFPKKSEYMYGDTAEMENPRTKLSFFQTVGKKLKMNIDNDAVTFVGPDLSTDDADGINGYAFQSASNQVELFLSSFKKDWQDAEFLRLVDEYCANKKFSVFNGVNEIITNEEVFYTTMLAAFPSDKPSCTDTARLDIVEATVDNFEVDFKGFGTDGYMKTNTDYTLYVNGEHNLDENKLSLAACAFAKNKPITNLLKNVAIRFQYWSGDWKDVDLTQPNAQISVKGGETVEVDGKTYICPNTNVADLNYAYYTIHTNGNFSFQMEVVLITHNKAGGNSLFTDPKVYSFIAKPAPETDSVSWTETDLTMQLSGEGDVHSSPVNLDLYSIAPAEETKVYFANFGEDAANAKNLADRIIGADAYDESRAGLYGGLYLFPLVNPRRLIAIGAGQFDLYFATIRTASDGHTPEYEEDGRYILNNITQEPIKVKAVRSLYSESVTGLNAYITPTADLTDNGENIYVYDNSNVTLHLEFTINDDSREVFATELKNGNIKLVILNSLGEDISTYFSGGLTTDLNGATLVYDLTFVGLGRGASEVTIGDARLEFEDLTWTKPIKHQDTKNIVLYTPTPNEITVEYLVGGVNNESTVEVSQTLSDTGEFVTSIGEESVNVQEWINEHLAIIVTDNHDNTKVFENSWRFESGNSKALMISADGHSFTFGTVESETAVLYVVCGTVGRKTVFTFEISSTGLTELDYSNSDQIDDDLTTDSDDPDAKKTLYDDLSQVTVKKYGEADKTITLANLIELRSGETTINSATGFLFRLSPSWLHSSALSEQALLDLLGEGGMLTLTGRDIGGEEDAKINVAGIKDANDLRAALEGKIITQVKINHDFGSKTQGYQSVQFEIVDSKLNYTINISFTLNLLSNKTLSTDTESDVTAYAEVEIAPKGEIVTQGAAERTSVQEKIASLYDGYKIADKDGDGVYELVSAKEALPEGTKAVGEITAEGKFKFYDIWTEKDENYIVRFSLESKTINSHTLTHEIVFTIQRNLKITQTQEGGDSKHYQIFGGSENISEYFSLERVEGSAPITLPKGVTVAISTDGQYLGIDGGGYDGGLVGQLSVKTAPLFRKNNSVLSQNIYFTIDNNDLGSFTLKYELGIANEKFAEVFKRGNEPITTQVLNGVTHLLFEDNMTYTLSAPTTSDGYRYSIKNNFSGYTGAGVYNLTGDSNINIYNNSANTLISGINEDRYLIVEFSKDEEIPLAYSLVPILVSSVRTNFVKYTPTSGHTGSENTNLNTALLDAEALIEEGIFQEVEGGHAQSLDASSGFGFFYSSTGKVIDAVSQYTAAGELIPGTDIKKAINGTTIYINHLEGTTYKDGIYLFVTMHIVKDGKSIDFHYLLKVTPSVTTSVKYPYETEENDNKEEHLQPKDNGEFESCIDNVFDETALNSGASRFNITASDLKYTYKVESINGLSEEDMSEALTISWSRADDDDTHYSKMTVSLKDPNDNTIYRIKVKRVYNGGERDTDYAVFGNKETYTFVINAIKNYVIRYGTGATTSIENPNNATWIVEPEADNASQTLDVPLYLSDSMTSIPANTLKFFVNSKDLEGLGWTPEDNVKYGENVTSEGISLSGGVLTIIRPSYVAKDTNIRVYFYTEFGLTGTLTITLKSSITYTLATDRRYTEGGHEFSEFITKLENNGEELTPDTDFTITNASQTTHPNGHADFFKYDAEAEVGKPFIIYPTTQDYEIGVSITVELTNISIGGEKATATFDFSITVLKGITPEEEVSHSGSVNTGSFEVTETRLYQIVPPSEGSKTAFNAAPTMKFSWRNESGNYLVEEMDKQNNISIEAKSVDAETPVTAIITVYLYTTGETGDNYYESFEVRYHVTLTPSTKIDVTYPDPENVGRDKVVKAEYLEDGYTMQGETGEHPLDVFFTGYPNFVDGSKGENKRLYFTDLKTSTNSGDFATYHNNEDGYEKTVSIYSMQNIAVKYSDGTSSTPDTFFNEQSGDIYSQIEVGNILTLSMGEDSLLESFVIFQIECNGAIAQYKVILQKQVYDININYAQTDENGNEVFYVENLNQEGADDIFASNRLLKFRLGSLQEIQTVIGGNFRWVLYGKDAGDTSEKYIALDLRPQRFKSSDAGKQFVIDLGRSYANYEYVGTYYYDNDTVKRIESGTDISNSEIDRSNLANDKLDTRLYAIGQTPNLCQRVELYTLQGNSRVLVDAANYMFQVKVKVTDDEGADTYPYLSNVKISSAISDSDLGETKTFYGFQFADGGKMKNKEVEFADEQYNYNYVLKLDIAIGSSGINSVQEVIAGDEKDPSKQAILTQRNQITHPSTGLPLSEEELLDATSNKTISLKIVGIDEAWNDATPDGNTTETGQQIKLADYLAKYPGINTPYHGGDKNYRYLSLATREDGTEDGTDGRITNFLITGRGAPAGGAYVLLKFNYQVEIGGEADGEPSILSKPAYLVYKVLPGYMITLQTTTYDASETVKDEIISNEENAGLYSTTGNTYNTILVAGVATSDTKAIAKVTARHQEQDISVSNFKYTMTLEASKNSKQYNIKNNIKQKFTSANFASPWQMWNDTDVVSGNVNFDKTFNKLKYDNPRDDAKIQFNNVAAVIMSDQYYFLEAEDNYGFKFQVYFTLVARNQSPTSASGTINITEKDPFDVFAQYSILDIQEFDEIEEEGGGKIIPIQVTSTPASILSEDTYKFFVIEGLNAWGFRISNGKTIDDYLTVQGGKYVAKTDGDKKYSLNAGTDMEGMRELTITNLDFYKINIAKIDFQTKDGESVEDIDTNNPSLSNKRLATSGDLSYSGQTSFKEDGGGDENAYNNATYFGARTKKDSKPYSRFYMPEIDSSYYHGRNSVPLNMVVTLQYKLDTGGYEEFTVSYNINLSKNATYDPVGITVRDGEAFNIEDAIMSGFRNGDKDGNTTYYNDTLEVTLPADSGDVTLTIGDNKTTLRNTSSYPKTQYVSISNVIGETASPNDEFTVKIDAGSELKPLGVDGLDYYGAYVVYRTSESSDTETLYEMYYKKDKKLYSKTSTSETESDGMNITIGQIVKDKINFISADEMPMIGQAQFVSKTKYYIAKTTLQSDGLKGPYEVARQYSVVPYYSRLSKNYSTFKLVDKYFKKTAEGKTTYKVPVQGWTEGMTLDVTRATFSSYELAEYDSFNANAVNADGGPLYFETNNTETAGAVTVDSDTGVIETTDKFNIESQHAIIDVYIKASGLKGDFKSASTAAPKKLLGSVEFQLQIKGASEFEALDDATGLTLQNIGYTNGRLGFITETVGGLDGYSGTLVTPALVKGMNADGLTNVEFDKEQRIFDKEGAPLYQKSADGTSFTKMNTTVSKSQSKNWDLGYLKQDDTIVVEEGSKTIFYIPYSDQSVGQQKVRTYVKLSLKIIFDKDAKVYKSASGGYTEVPDKTLGDLEIDGEKVESYEVFVTTRPGEQSYFEITADDGPYYLNINDSKAKYESVDDEGYSAKVVTVVNSENNMTILGVNMGNAFILLEKSGAYYSIASAFGYKKAVA